jgi:CheY-like chemotaxis protein
MNRSHLALTVEDDAETADDLREILDSLDCGSVTVSNAEDALRELQKKSFCLILLDLQIKGGSRRNQRACRTRQVALAQDSAGALRA